MSAQAVAPITSLMVYVQARKSHALPELNTPRVVGLLQCLFNYGIWRRVRWARDVACMEETRSVYEILVGKPEETEGRRRWEGNIQMYVEKTGC
jgi:hypothetical protein